MVVKLGVVAIDKKTLKPYPGASYSAGAKVYASEATARSSVKQREEHYYNHLASYDVDDYWYFVEATSEIPDQP